MIIPRYRSDSSVSTMRWVREKSGGPIVEIVDRARVIDSAFLNPRSSVGNPNDIHVIRFNDGHQTFRYANELF